MSFLTESRNDAEVFGNNAEISVENIIPPNIKKVPIMPNFSNIIHYFKKMNFRLKLKKIIKNE
jgi:hypothetical protein